MKNPLSLLTTALGFSSAASQFIPKVCTAAMKRGGPGLTHELAQFPLTTEAEQTALQQRQPLSTTRIKCLPQKEVTKPVAAWFKVKPLNQNKEKYFMFKGIDNTNHHICRETLEYKYPGGDITSLNQPGEEFPYEKAVSLVANPRIEVIGSRGEVQKMTFQQFMRRFKDEL